MTFEERVALNMGRLIVQIEQKAAQLDEAMKQNAELTAKVTELEKQLTKKRGGKE